MTKRLAVPLVVLLAAALACVLPGNASQSDLDNAVSERDALRTQTADMQAELDRLEGAVQDQESLQADLTQATDQLDALRQEYDQLSQDYDQISQAHEDIQQALEEVSVERDDWQEEYDALWSDYGMMVCSGERSIFDFSQPDDADQKLIDWVFARATDEEELLETNNEVIWSNSDSRLVTFRYEVPAESLTVKQIFVVYVADDTFSDSIYWVNGACWLYPP